MTAVQRNWGGKHSGYPTISVLASTRGDPYLRPTLLSRRSSADAPQPTLLSRHCPTSENTPEVLANKRKTTKKRFWKIEILDASTLVGALQICNFARVVSPKRRKLRRSNFAALKFITPRPHKKNLNALALSVRLKSNSILWQISRKSQKRGGPAATFLLSLYLKFHPRYRISRELIWKVFQRRSA